MNIIVLVIDTLRYDHIGAHGNAWIKTPNLDHLAAESWVFDRAYAASFPTIPHRTDVLTGRYGGPFHPWRPLRHDVPTLPRALSDIGYATQLIHDTPHLVNGGHNFDWPFHAWTCIRGTEVDRPWITDSLVPPANWKLDPMFDAVGQPPNPEQEPFWATYIRANRKRRADADWNASRLFLTACEFLKDNAGRDNFFLWVDCFDPHEPWEAPPEYLRMYDDTPGYDGSVDPRIFTTHHADIPMPLDKRSRAAYAANVSRVDRWIGEFLDALERLGLKGRTAVVLTSDHGTNLSEWGVYGKTWPVREFEAHVPLFIRVPGAGAGRSDVIVQPQDLFATVMGIAGEGVLPDIESFNVLAAAQEGNPRRFALSASGADAWAADQTRTFSLFGDEWYLLMAPRPDQCRLFRAGSQTDVAADNTPVVERLREEALDELTRRGAHSDLVEWFRSEGNRPFPESVPLWDGWPGPAGYEPYWQRLYRDRD
ncbi:MAG: sulfatase [Alphaproteobacteria bacterium]